ncbi:MAG: sulfatase [Planctomycetota bacterium]|jgi:arylsulfatase A-like enzyme
MKTRRDFLKRLMIAAVAAPGFSAGYARSVPKKKRKPNVLLILADDLGAADTILGGSTFHRTPNMERLAKSGMLLTNAYSASPLCSPTRASIMTGQSPARCGITSPGCHLTREIFKPSVQTKTRVNVRQFVTQSATRLSTDHYTLAEALKDAGYATAHFGKWHLGREPYTPLEHGFDVDVPHWPGPGPAGSFVAPWKFPRFKERYPREHIEDRMGDEVVEFMEQHKDKAFFVNYWQFSVHAPFNAKDELIEKYKKRVDPKNPQQSPTYAAMVQSLDDNVGKMLDAIDRLGIAENTIIIFYSDNGGNMYNLVDGTTATSNAPFRGGKATMYEGGIRVPVVFVWPGVIQCGTRSEALIQSEDLYATILEMVGLPPQPKQALDSISAVPALKGKPGLREAVYTFFPHSPPVPDFLPPSVAVRKGDWKLIRVFNDDPDQSHRYELYNLKEDIRERNNLAARQSERVRQMDKMIETFLKNTKATLPQPNLNYDPKRPEQCKGFKSVGYVRLHQRDAGLQIRSFGEDPMMIETVERFSFKPEAHTLVFRMRSLSASGPGHIYWADVKKEFDEKHATKFTVVDDGLWHKYNVELPFSTSVGALRISPASTQGVVHVEWIRMRNSQGELIKEWDYRKKVRKSRSK